MRVRARRTRVVWEAVGRKEGAGGIDSNNLLGQVWLLTAGIPPLEKVGRLSRFSPSGLAALDHPQPLAKEKKGGTGRRRHAHIAM